MISADPKDISRKLLLLAFLFGAAIFSPTLSRAQAPAAAGSSWIQDGETLAKRIQTNTSRLQQSQQLDGQLRQMLASIPQPSREDLVKTGERHKALQVRLSVLDKAFNEFKATNSTGAASIAELEKQLADVEKERDRLVKKQADLSPESGPTNGTKGLKQEARLTGMKPIDIKLVKNRVVPGREPFYSFTPVQLKLALTGEVVSGVRITRVHDGESVGNAVKPGGLLDILLNKADPKQSYFRLLVCADSIAGFPVVAEAVSKRGFAYSWDTSNDEDILQQLRTKPDSESHDRGYLPLQNGNQQK